MYYINLLNLERVEDGQRDHAQARQQQDGIGSLVQVTTRPSTEKPDRRPPYLRLLAPISF